MSDTSESRPVGKGQTVTPEPEAPVAPTRTAAKRGPRGIHVVYDAAGKPLHARSVEIDALRDATHPDVKGSTKFVEYGQPF